MISELVKILKFSPFFHQFSVFLDLLKCFFLTFQVVSRKLICIFLFLKKSQNTENCSLSNLWRLSLAHFFAFCLSFPKWCNTYTFVEEIKALEYQTFSTHFLSKFMFFWITQKVTFFTHPNDFLGNNSNNPMGTTGFHAFFENLWLSP